MITDVGSIYGGNPKNNLTVCCNNDDKKLQSKQPKVKPSSGVDGVLTAADMYESGFRIRNTGLCSDRTRLLVLITSAAAPSHSQNRQAIRMTWMNRYGPSVSMAFLVGTPQMSETDPVAKLLEAEEHALQVRLSRIDFKNKDNPKEKVRTKQSMGVASGATDVFVNPVNGDPGWYRFLRDRGPNPREGLDALAMHGLNTAERAVQRVLGREHSQYGDLVQCHSRDTYTNLTLKSIAALEWTRQYCSSARYLLKTDDDMFIDIRRLLRFIDKVETEAITESGVSSFYSRQPPPLNMDENNFLPIEAEADIFESSVIPNFDVEIPPTIWGRLAHGWRPIRQNNSKYYVSRMQYYGKVFPDFCTGPAYLMTRSAVGPLYEGALGRDFDVVDDGDEDDHLKNKNNNTDLGKNLGNKTLNAHSDKVATSLRGSGKNTVPYLKLEDVYLTGVVAERLSRRADERLARQKRKKKDNISFGNSVNDQNASSDKMMSDFSQLDSTNSKLKTADIIVKVRRIHDDQFANKKITGRALEKAVCSGVSPGDTAGTGGNGGFSWFRWYWGDTPVNKDLKKKKKDQGVISLHMVKYYEQFDLWRRLMDGRIKCKS